MVKFCPYESVRGSADQSVLAFVPLAAFTVSRRNLNPKVQKEIRYWMSLS
jgi:hypothetical protein